MEQFCILIAIFLVILIAPASTYNNQCIEYSNGYCLRCKDNYRLVEGRCRHIVPGCKEYSKDTCLRCIDGSLTAHGQCPPFQNNQNTDLTLYMLAFGKQNIGFVPIPLEQSKKDILFMKCDNFIRMGEYSHFITKSQTPWQSISLQVNETFHNYRIIYVGTGGGLMLCLMSINIQTLQPSITSLVTISSQEEVPHCLDYSQCGKCSQCSQGYHLQQNKCYMDIAGCVSYYQQLCLQCHGWALLIQNRCLTDCPSQCDLVHAQFYGNTLLAQKIA